MREPSPRGPRISAEWGRGLPSISPAVPSADPQVTVCHPRPPGYSVLRKRPRAPGFEWRTLNLPVHPGFQASGAQVSHLGVGRSHENRHTPQIFRTSLTDYLQGKMVEWVQPQEIQGCIPTGCWMLISKVKFKQLSLGLIFLFIFFLFFFVCLFSLFLLKFPWFSFFSFFSFLFIWGRSISLCPSKPHPPFEY